MTLRLRTLSIWGFIGALLIGVCVVVAQNNPSGAAKPIPYSQFNQRIEAHEIKSVKIKGDEISGEDKTRGEFTTISPPWNDGLGERLEAQGVVIESEAARPSLLMGLIQAVLPILLLAGLWILIMRQMQRQGVVGSGKSKGRPQPNPASPDLYAPTPELAALQARIDDQALHIRDLQSALKQVDAALNRASLDIEALKRADAAANASIGARDAKSIF